jgi:DNA-binding NtrC family response regulator
MMTISETIDVNDLPGYLHSSSRNAGPAHPGALEDLNLEAHEKQLVVEALARTQGNQSQAARQLRIGRDSLRYKMKKFGLDNKPSSGKAAIN